jgi:hypothetical protein
MQPNDHLIALGEAIHDAIRQYAVERRKLHGWRPSGIEPNLQGACVAAAYLLALEANKLGIECQMLLGHKHAFILHEGIIYDPTFVQFLRSPYEEPSPDDPKVQVWLGQIPAYVVHRYHSSFDTTQQTLDYLKYAHPDEAIDGYQLHWLSATSAHVSWFGDRVCINPMH